MESFTAFFGRIWGSALPHRLAWAIGIAVVFELLTWLLSKRLRAAFAGVLQRDLYLDATERVGRRKIILGVPLLLGRSGLFCLGILIIVRYLGFDTGHEIIPLLVTLLALTGLIFWQPLRDAAAGYFIAYDNLYNVGEKVTLGDVSGTVTEFTLRRTVLAGQDGREVTLPNSQVSGVVNHSRAGGPGSRPHMA
jgi:small-conductance mechanosensitive channel